MSFAFACEELEVKLHHLGIVGHGKNQVEDRLVPFDRAVTPKVSCWSRLGEKTAKRC